MRTATLFAVIEYTTEACDELQTYDMSQDYFRFMFTEGVEPTNNHSEQQIRHCVIDRRITQGTRGELGQRYHERMWTAIASCKKQQRSFFLKSPEFWCFFGSVWEGSRCRPAAAANALRCSRADFLSDSAKTQSLAKFINQRQDPERMQIFRLAA